MNRHPFTDLLCFLLGGALFCAGLFLLANQVLAGTVFGSYGWGRFGGSPFHAGAPFGMGLWMVPLAIGVCLMVCGLHRRWAQLMVWGSAGAIAVGVLNSIRLAFIPTTLWQLGSAVVMVSAGAGLIVRSLGSWGGPLD